MDTLRHSYSLGDLSQQRGLAYEGEGRGDEGDWRREEGDGRGYGTVPRGYTSGGDDEGYSGDRRGPSDKIRGYRTVPRVSGSGGRRSQEKEDLSQSWHEGGRNSSLLWQEPEEGPRRRPRAHTGSHELQRTPSRSPLLALEDNSAATLHRRATGPRLRQSSRPSSLYGTLPRASTRGGGGGRTPRLLPEPPPSSSHGSDPPTVRRTWHGRESTRDQDLGRTVSASPVRRREGARVARPVKRPKKPSPPASNQEVQDDFSMTYSEDAAQGGRRQCDIS